MINDDLSIAKEDRSAKRVGSRIRLIREEHIPPMTQSQLGESVGLNQNRIQQYENGVRKPKAELLNRIADALGVAPEALADPDITNEKGVMFAFFEMERLFGLEITEVDGTISLTFPQGSTVSQYLKNWLKERSERDRQMKLADNIEEKHWAMHKYHLQEWNFGKEVEELQEDRTIE